MKKVVSIVLIIAIMLTFTACGLSDEEKAKVANVDESIMAIGEVSLSKKTDIDALKESVNELGELEKYLENKKTYDEIVSSYSELVKEEAAKIDKEIELIAKVNKDNLLDVENARIHYNNSNSDVKTAVKNKAILEASVKSAEKVKKAQKEEANKLLKTFKVEYDEVRGLTFYIPKCVPKYINTRTYCLPYLSKSNNGYTLFLDVNYFNDEWIFFKQLLFLADNERFSQDLDYFKINHDVVDGGVCENTDIVVSEEGAENLLKLANAKRAIVRFNGDAYFDEIVLSQTDKKAIRDIVNAYLILK